MLYDRQITISVVPAGRHQLAGPDADDSELYDRLRLPAMSTETMVEYLPLSKGQQDNLKDVGGFVAGALSRPRRKAEAVTGRDLLTPRPDNIPDGGTDDVVRRVGGPWGAATASLHPQAPRIPLRVLLPHRRTATAYESTCARYMAQ